MGIFFRASYQSIRTIYEEILAEAKVAVGQVLHKKKENSGKYKVLKNTFR